MQLALYEPFYHCIPRWSPLPGTPGGGSRCVLDQHTLGLNLLCWVCCICVQHLHSILQCCHGINSPAGAVTPPPGAGPSVHVRTRVDPEVGPAHWPLLPSQVQVALLPLLLPVRELRARVEQHTGQAGRLLGHQPGGTGLRAGAPRGDK